MSAHEDSSGAHRVAGAARPVDVVVVGAGPSGMMAAISAAGRGASVVVCEHLLRPGVKLLATGGGHCNLTNTLATDAFMAAFGRQGRFMQPSLDRMDNGALRQFFAGLGVETEVADGFHVFPRSGQSSTVQQALLRRCEELGVAIRAGVTVTHLRLEPGRLAGVETSAGPIDAPRVIVATGGRGYPALGGTGGGYELARQAGHALVTPTPALSPLVTAEAWPMKLAGISLPDVTIRIDLPRQPKKGVRGIVLFTHRGISGPVVLDLSREIPPLLAGRDGVPLLLNLAPDMPLAGWRDRFEAWRATDGRKLIRGLLGECAPAALAATLCDLAGVAADTRAAMLPGDRRDELARLLTACPLTVTGAEGWAHAMATRGGVSLREVSPDTLQSRLVEGLFFCGEVLDLDGPCGGYNLQWAFASGHLAGLSAGEGGAR